MLSVADCCVNLDAKKLVVCSLQFGGGKFSFFKLFEMCFDVDMTFPVELTTTNIFIADEPWVSLYIIMSLASDLQFSPFLMTIESGIPIDGGMSRTALALRMHQLD